MCLNDLEVQSLEKNTHILDFDIIAYDFAYYCSTLRIAVTKNNTIIGSSPPGNYTRSANCTELNIVQNEEERLRNGKRIEELVFPAGLGSGAHGRSAVNRTVLSSDSVPLTDRRLLEG